MKNRFSMLLLVTIFTLPVLIRSSTMPNLKDYIPVISSMDSIDSGKSLKEALLLFDSSKYEQALPLFENVLINHLRSEGQKPDSIWWIDFLAYHNYKAQTLNKLTRHQEVIDTLEAVIKKFTATQNELHPELAKTYTHLGIAYLKLEKTDKSFLAHRKALKIRAGCFADWHPDVIDSYYNIGLAYAEMGKLDTAIIFYDKALSYYGDSIKYYDKSAPVITAVGIVYYKQGKFEKALSYFKQALEKHIKIKGEIHQDIAGIYNNIGVVYYRIGKYEEANHYFEKAISIKK